MTLVHFSRGTRLGGRASLRSAARHLFVMSVSLVPACVLVVRHRWGGLSAPSAVLVFV